MKQIIVAAALTAAAIVVNTADVAHAGQIEQPDHAINGRLQVYYAEPTPTDRFLHRTYFETTDGASYTYVSNGSCERDNKVPNRICHTVFWYAR